MNGRSFRAWSLVVIAIAAGASGCTRIITNNFIVGIHDATVGSATDLIDAFFGSHFGLNDETDQTGTEGNDLHVHI